MKVKIVEDGLLIVPETEFEEDYLSSHFCDNKSFTTFLKSGASPKDIIGLRVGFEANEV